MKPLTEAQVMGFRGAMLPPSRRDDAADRYPAAEQPQMSRQRTATRRAIEEYHEQRAARLAQEL